MKKVIISCIVIPFVLILVFYAVIIPVAELAIPPYPPTDSFVRYENNGFLSVWGATLVYYSFNFLIAAWLPYMFLQNILKNIVKHIDHFIVRIVLLCILQIVPVFGGHFNEGFFRYGNGWIKWGYCFPDLKPCSGWYSGPLVLC